MTRLVPFLLVLVALPAAAQTAAEHYHAAAQHYIAEDNAEAERAAVAGLALAPDDRKLQALLDTIREEREQQSGRQQNRDDADEQQAGEGDPQQDRDDAGEPQPSDDGEPDDPAQDEQQPGAQQRDNQQPEGLQPEEPSDAQPEDEREGDAGSAGEPDDGSAESGDGTASPHDLEPGTMSRAEAERILRAIEADELELLRDVQRRRSRPRYVEKDW